MIGTPGLFCFKAYEPGEAVVAWILARRLLATNRTVRDGSACLGKRRFCGRACPAWLRARRSIRTRESNTAATRPRRPASKALAPVMARRTGEGNARNGNTSFAWAFAIAANFALRYCQHANQSNDCKKANAMTIKALAHKLTRRDSTF